MDEQGGDEDGWVVARVAALERANRRLWVGLAALAMTLASLCIAAWLVAANLELPESAAGAREGKAGGSVVADDVTVRGALRVVDDAGRNLVFIGRERAAAGASAEASQAVIGLFAGAAPEAPQQTIRLATSALGSALSLSTPDGTRSVSLFAGEAAVSLDLRRGETSRVISERADGAPAGQAAASEGPSVEMPTASAPASGEARGAPIDLSDAALQPVGNGFYVGGLALSDQSGGLRVRGRLVNSTSVDQLRVEFRLLVGGRELPFTVGRIPAGGSTVFAVELPPAKAEALRGARMRWVRSTVSYRAD